MPRDLLAARSPVVFAYNGGIGDRLCNLPTLRALEFLYGNRLTLICGRGDRRRYYSDLELRSFYEIGLTQTETGWLFDEVALRKQIADCDLFLCINPWHTASVSALLARLEGVESVGFFPEFRHRLPCDYYGHAMEMAFAIPAFLSCEMKLEAFSKPPAISVMAMSFAHKLKQISIGGHHTVFVHADTKPEKSWSRDHFCDVINRFLNEFPSFKAFIVDLKGDGVGAMNFPERVISLNIPLETCFALLRASELFLGIDSCHLHAADLFRVPGVGIFGPTTCRRWGFRFSTHRHFQGRGRTDTVEVSHVYEAICDLARLVLRRAELTGRNSGANVPVASFYS